MSDGLEIDLNGERLVLLPAGALYWPKRAALIVADMHFEKGSSYARKGVFLPPYDTRTTIGRLRTLCRRLAPRLVISLGDAFHDREAFARLDPEDAAALKDVVAEQRFVWICGNHDPDPPRGLGGEAAPSLALGGLTFVHEPGASGVVGEVAGHLHPAARVRSGGATTRRRCFAVDAARLVLPAFGAYAGGLNVLDDAFAPLFPERLTACVLGSDGVYPFRRAALSPDAAPARRRKAG
ncbi:MAG: ligase-associated DNA damage response endonuclease PdeM [Pseudomonadota bacterium]